VKRTATDSGFFPPHVLNRDFKWIHRSGPFRCLSNEQIAAYDRDGYVVLENAIAPEVVAAITAEVDRHIPREKSFWDSTFEPHLAATSVFLRDFCRGRLFRDIAFDLIGPDVRLYWEQAVYRWPGTSPFAWHQDNGYQFVRPQQYVTCWIPLTDVTAANGCLLVSPGSHRWGTLEHHQATFGFSCVQGEQPTANVTTLPTKAGSVVILSSLIPHASRANSTDEVRKAYVVQFVPHEAECMRDGTWSRCNSPTQIPILVGGASPTAADRDDDVQRRMPARG
jgi:phytanoyl-CoA hydroxylase